MKKNIYCDDCGELIESKDDLIVAAAIFFFVAPYHTSCYSKALKGVETVFLQKYPMNSILSTVLSVLGALIFIVITPLVVIYDLYSDKSILLVLLALFLQSIARLYSWYGIERHLS